MSALLDAMVAGPADEVDVAALAAATPAGPVDLPLAVVGLEAGVRAAAAVDPAWLAEVDAARAVARATAVATGRAAKLEAALRVALPRLSEILDPADDEDVDAHVASGARLWLLAGAVASEVAGSDPDPFAPWAALLVAGWWPVGPSGGRLVVSTARRR